MEEIISKIIIRWIISKNKKVKIREKLMRQKLMSRG